MDSHSPQAITNNILWQAHSDSQRWDTMMASPGGFSTGLGVSESPQLVVTRAVNIASNIMIYTPPSTPTYSFTSFISAGFASTFSAASNMAFTSLAASAK